MIGQSIGWDFMLFWQIGRGVLAGVDPYSLPYPRYPPSTLYLFSIFGVLPLEPAYIIWTILNILLFIDVFRRLEKARYAIPWFLFTPTLFTLLTGQLEIFFLWIASWMQEKGWRAVVAGAILTLKPQVAYIILPWFLWQWLRHDRPQLIRWVGVTTILQGFPALWDPGLFARWLNVNSDQADWRMKNSPGMFILTNFDVSIILLIVAALIIVFWGLRQDRWLSWAAQQFTNPIGMWYQGTLLVRAAPAWFLVPLSWVAFILSAVVKNSIPNALISLGCLGWLIARQRSWQFNPLRLIKRKSD